jgi:hypothetical protein
MVGTARDFGVSPIFRSLGRCKVVSSSCCAAAWGESWNSLEPHKLNFDVAMPPRFGLHRVSRLDPGTNAVRKVFSDLEPDCPNRRQVIAVNLADPARNTARPPRRSGRRRQS